MCGIAGIVSLGNRPPVERELRDMCAAITHRGPDDEGVYVDQYVGLGMRRLSIIDLSAGHQPIGNEDGSVQVVLNGEIYNFKELRRDLQARGHVFSTSTDTETIVHLYEEHGKDCVRYLRGMFGFALWDRRKREFLLARDRVGIKPLYYTVCGGRLLFASELKSILQLPDAGRDISWSAVSHLFTFLSTPPDESVIEGIRKLEPGCRLTVSAQREPVIEKYWNLRFEPDYGKDEEYFIERTRELLHESVRLHMVSDVPLGAFLSGGIDSSGVVAAAASMIEEPLKTFSIGFTEPAYNELEYAHQVATKFGADHHDLILGDGVFDEIERLAWYLDEPFGDSSAIPTYVVSKLASQHVKVVLSGDGGDELFAGYDRYVVEERERERAPLPASRLLTAISRNMPGRMRGRNYLRHFSLSGAERYLDACTLFRREDMRQLFHGDVFEMLEAHEPWRAKAAHMESQSSHWLTQLQSLDINNYLPLDILTKVDRMSMAHSIETRVPLLDHKLVEFAATIPPELNLRGGTTKYILKSAMRGILPDQIIDRPKRGFAVPLNFWFRGKLNSYLRDVVLGERSRQRGILNTRYVERLIARHERGQNLDLQIWTLISFELWARTFLDSASARSVAA